MSQVVRGRLVLADEVVPGSVELASGIITGVTRDESVPDSAPYITPGFVDVHVHGWGGHDAMGGTAALDGMSRALLRHGITSFLPTAVTAPIADLQEFAARVRSWMGAAPADGAQPLGFNLEGPFLAPSRRGAHDPALLAVPADVPQAQVTPLVENLRVITIAPELPGALDLIASLAARGVAVSLGHSAATFDEARAGYSAGARTTTHLFNAMSGVEHRAPGLAVAALLDDDVYVELIADGIHVNRALWPLIVRIKPAERLLLVSDAISLAGMGDGRARVGTLDVEVHGGRVTLVGSSTLAGSVLSLDVAVRNLVENGTALAQAVAAASRNPLALLGVTDRGRIAEGQRADLVELSPALEVARVMRAGAWVA